MNTIGQEMIDEVGQRAPSASDAADRLLDGRAGAADIRVLAEALPDNGGWLEFFDRAGRTLRLIGDVRAELRRRALRLAQTSVSERGPAALHAAREMVRLLADHDLLGDDADAIRFRACFVGDALALDSDDEAIVAHAVVWAANQRMLAALTAPERIVPAPNDGDAEIQARAERLADAIIAEVQR